MTYQRAMSLLSEARSKSAGKPIGNNTRLFDRGTHVAIRLHATDVVELYPNGDVVLNSGGWRTVTTKARMNEYAPCVITQKNGDWFVRYAGETYGYCTGMRLCDDGTVQYPEN